MAQIIVGIPDFETLRTKDIVYVDKTQLLYTIVRNPGYYFFARPRRFGKTLLLSTFEKIFEARRDLFEGLAISSTDYDWVQRPVIRIGLARINCDTPEIFEAQLNAYLLDIALSMGVVFEAHHSSPNLKLTKLVEALYKSSGKKVVLLIDEYDKPILEHLSNAKLTTEIRDRLGNFYGAIKDLDKSLHFVFFTGVTKFARTSVFSKLNNLLDLSLSPDYAGLLGYTEKELQENFADYHKRAAIAQGLTQKKLSDKIREWYNGFRFSSAPLTVYNPISVMTFYFMRQFDNFWFNTGTPTFLYNLIRERHIDVSTLTPARITQQSGTSYEPTNVPIEHMLFQTGYLTIVAVDAERREFILDYPNREVRDALMEGLFEDWTGFDKGMGLPAVNDLIDALNNNDVSLFCALIRSMIANIPGVLHLPAEAYYHSLIIMIAQMMQFRVSAEEQSNKGFIDLVVETKKHIYIIEFKHQKSSRQALNQIKERAYFEKYLHARKPIILVGLTFRNKNISEPVIETIAPLVVRKPKGPALPNAKAPAKKTRKVVQRRTV